MPIDIQCPHCQSMFRVLEKFAGKRVKCANCHGTIEVPAMAALLAEQPQPPAGQPATAGANDETTYAWDPGPSATPDAVAPAGWYVQLADGHQFGPLSRSQLDAWLAEGRINTSCQLLQEGWSQWKWADEVYPQLKEKPAADTAETLQQAASAPVVPYPEAVSEPQRAEAALPSEVLPSDYPALATISRIYGLSAWGIAAVGGLVAVLLAVVCVLELVVGGASAVGLIGFFLSELVVLALTFLGWLALKALSEVIKLAIDIHRELRGASQAWTRTVDLLTKQQT